MSNCSPKELERINNAVKMHMRKCDNFETFQMDHNFLGILANRVRHNSSITSPFEPHDVTVHDGIIEVDGSALAKILPDADPHAVSKFKTLIGDRSGLSHIEGGFKVG